MALQSLRRSVWRDIGSEPKTAVRKLDVNTMRIGPLIESSASVRFSYLADLIEQDFPSGVGIEYQTDFGLYLWCAGLYTLLPFLNRGKSKRFFSPVLEYRLIRRRTL